jgi:very-short-patch-repair endonuclease
MVPLGAKHSVAEGGTVGEGVLKYALFPVPFSSLSDTIFEMSVRNDSQSAVNRARKLRNQMTAMERALWHRIRKERLGCKFRRQYPAGPYVLDFYSPELRLCVEIDGPQHDEAADVRRDSYLLQRGILTHRVASIDVFRDADAVVEGLGTICRLRAEELAKPIRVFERWQ